MDILKVNNSLKKYFISELCEYVINYLCPIKFNLPIDVIYEQIKHIKIKYELASIKHEHIKQFDDDPFRFIFDVYYYYQKILNKIINVFNKYNVDLYKPKIVLNLFDHSLVIICLYDDQKRYHINDWFNIITHKKKYYFNKIKLYTTIDHRTQKNIFTDRIHKIIPNERTKELWNDDNELCIENLRSNIIKNEKLFGNLHIDSIMDNYVEKLNEIFT
jgi:hypothetical protein